MPSRLSLYQQNRRPEPEIGFTPLCERGQSLHSLPGTGSYLCGEYAGSAYPPLGDCNKVQRAITWIRALRADEAISPSTPMPRLSIDYRLGAVSDDFVETFEIRLRKARDELRDLLASLNEKRFLMGRKIQETVPIDLITKWISLCNAHGKVCKSPALPA
jgi:hypothetical protein